MSGLTSLELCAGAGGQALGLEQSGFQHLALVELDPHACATLRMNRPYWKTIEDDVRHWNATRFRAKVDVLAAGVPCPPFSKAGRQLGPEDDRDLFPQVMRLIRQCQPRAVMIENVRGLMDDRFAPYRAALDEQLRAEAYEPHWRILQASDFGVPQLRPRTLLVALSPDLLPFWRWPSASKKAPPTVGEVLREEMAAGGWVGAAAWAARANRIAPTLVGGSKKHGGPDLGPTRARRQWASLGVDGRRVVAEPPPPGFTGMPSLTVVMTSRLQGFPADWRFAGSRTHAYRQIGNAFPPPVARAVGLRLAAAIRAVRRQASADAKEQEAA
jgi:DNA (cytosine-5)-methyltransferase 1